MEYPEIKFYRTQMRRLLLIEKIKADPNLFEIFKKNKDITTIVDDDIKQRMRGSLNNFVTLFILGQQGDWKSSTAINISTKHDTTKFDAERIAFEYENFKKKISESQPKNFFQLDEEVFKFGTGSRRIIDEIQTLIETLRKRQNSLIIVTPEKKYFDENLFTYTLEMLDNRIIANCPHNKKKHDPRTCQCDLDNTYKVIYAESRALVKKNGQYIGFYRCPIAWDTQLWKDYNKLKDEFNEKILASKQNETQYEKIAAELLSHKDIDLYKNKNQLKLFVAIQKPNITVMENTMIVEAMIIERKKQQLELNPDFTKE